MTSSNTLVGSGSVFWPQKVERRNFQQEEPHHETRP